MKINSLLMAFAIVAFSLALTACDFNGGVDQGRCVAFNADAKTVTLVVDTSLDQHNPHYSGEIVTFKLPLEAIDMGPVPVPGGRLQIEQDKNQILIFDPATKSIRQVPAEFTEVVKKVSSKDPRVQGKKFPTINKENKTITVYSRRLQELVTFKVPDEFFALPADTWNAGDEVRIAFRKDNKDQAIRLMNVTKTNIFAR